MTRPTPEATSGPEHYAKSAHLAEVASRHITEDAADMRIAEVAAYAAQAHATLALAAAQALPTVVQYMGDSDTVTDWATVTGVKPPTPIFPDHTTGTENSK